MYPERKSPIGTDISFRRCHGIGMMNSGGLERKTTGLDGLSITEYFTRVVLDLDFFFAEKILTSTVVPPRLAGQDDWNIRLHECSRVGHRSPE